MKSSLIKTILIYIVFFIIVVLLYKYNKLESYSIYIILSFVWIVIRDMLIYFVDTQNKYLKQFSREKLFKDFSKGRILYLDFILVLNRNIIFPLLLVLYMVYLLVWHTKLFWLDSTKVFTLINSNYLLIFIIITWIITIFKEDIDEKYFHDELEWWYFSKNIILTIILSLFWTYIIYTQVYVLWVLAYSISIISWILIFLVGVSIFEDDKN